MSYNFYNPPHQTLSIEINNGQLITKKGTQWEDRKNNTKNKLVHLKNSIDSSTI